MGKKDAFGRDVGEDPLKDLGWVVPRDGSYDTPLPPAAVPEDEEQRWAPAPETAPMALSSPAQVSQGTTAASPAARVRRARGSSAGGCFIAFVLTMLLVVGAVVVIALSTVGDEIAEIDSKIQQDSPLVAPGEDPGDEPGAAGTRAPAAPTAPPVGLQRGSLLLRANLAPVLRRMRTAGKGRLRSLRVAPDRVDLQLLTKDGRLRSVQARHDGKVQDFGTSGPGFGFVDTVPFGSVDAAAPARAVSRAAARLSAGTSRVDYLVLVGGGWSVFFKGGQHFQADDRGRIVRRVS